ncbi:hypothetical protein KR009_000915 [Drosophila setifemur]|nr:hypothetical protein KR009_000915 [Drosophila setifemur]
MNWHNGNIAEAVAESKAKDAVFVVYIEGDDEMSSKLERFVDDIRVRSLLETPDFVAIKVQGSSSAYGQFMSLYKVVPIPSLFFIGKTGTPLEIATGITASVEELVAKIDKVLILAGKKTAANPEPSSSSLVDEFQASTVRGFAGAEDANSLIYDNPEETESDADKHSKSILDEVDHTSKVAEPAPTPPVTPSLASSASSNASWSAAENRMMAAAIETEKRALATSVANAEIATAEAGSKVEAPASSSGQGARNMAASTLLPAVQLLNPAVPATAAPPAQTLSGSEARMAEVQQVLEVKKQERVEEERAEEERRREKENELRRRREGRELQTQQQLTKEQELKNMQERIRRDRQLEQEARERIRAQIAADRAEQARRTAISADMVNTDSAPSAVVTTETSVSSVDETRLQIRLPGGIHRTKIFPAAEVLATVRVYVRNEMLAGSDARDFTLATSYPRREFQLEDEVKTLNELSLVPNAVVLVLTKDNANRVVRSGGSLMTMVATVVWAMLTPAAKAFEYIHKMGLRPLGQKLTALMANFWGPGQQAPIDVVQGDAAARRNMDMFSLRPTPAPGFNYEEPQHAASTQPMPTPETTQGTGAEGRSAPQPQPGPGSPPQAQSTSQGQSHSAQEFQQRPGGYQPPRYGDANIRRLQDTKKDNDKDKATYNGNSTQQQ